MSETVKEKFERIKENRNKLNACPCHKFDLPSPPYKLGFKWTCLNCGGEMKGEAIFEYINGYVAAGGDANNIVEGWN